MLLGGIGFCVLPPLTFRCLQQDSTVYSFPYTCDSGHAIDAASCPGFDANKATTSTVEVAIFLNKSHKAGTNPKT